MSEAVMIAIIGASGAVAGAIITALANVVVASIQIQATKNTANKKTFTPSRSTLWWAMLPGSLLGLVISIVLALFLFQGSIFSSDDRTLSLEQLPFVAFTWAIATNSDETGSTRLEVSNDTKKAMYHFEYTLPVTSTSYSGAGLTFRFNDLNNQTEYDPQDLTEYSHVSVSITFDSPDAHCAFILWDVSDESDAVLLGPNVDLNADIDRKRNSLTETFTIPLGTYYKDVSLKDIKDMTCAVDTDISTGKHKLTIKDIVFLNK